MEDLHRLPKVRDRLSYVYVERGRVDRHEKSIAVHDKTGLTPIPAAGLCVLMLGPGTTITHAAVRALAENSCLVIWCGEENVRFYACGTGGTRSAYRLLQQARLASDDDTRLQVVRRMYEMRLGSEVPPELTLQQLQGMEGQRVRSAYAHWSQKTGVPWTGRSYDRMRWQGTDPVNRALSAANSCLYGVCHAAILGAGYSPAIGFIHTGKQLSFVYDIADLYKVDMTIPLAFELAAANVTDIEREARLRCRDAFREQRLLKRIVPDIDRALGEPEEEQTEELEDRLAEDPALPTELWEPDLPAGLPTGQAGTQGTPGTGGAAEADGDDDSSASRREGDAEWSC
jgi:CRISPR-associated protein Cas1